jgi:enoyl-CoA hydratase
MQKKGQSMLINCEKQNGIWTVMINRPEVKNAVDGFTAQALVEVFTAFEEDDSAKVAVLCGKDTFCAGADLKSITRTDGSSPKVKETGDGPMGPSRMRLTKPVIAAIEGYAVAGGIELALWCDLRVMAEDAIFGVFCRRFGVPLIDGGTVRLPRLIGMSRALDLILTGRPVKADEALHIGLANRVVKKGNAIAAAQKLAGEIAAFPELCMRNDRQSAYQQWDLDFESAMLNETKLGLEVIKKGETLEGATRFAKGEGRHGQFND